MKKATLVISLILSLALLEGTQAASTSPLPEGKSSQFAVPRIAVPPVIDGAIGRTEWRDALAIGGLASQNPGGNSLIMRPTTFFLAWDAENIYVACRTWIMPGYVPNVKGRAPGKANAFDDGMEFNLRPMGANLKEGATDNSYKFFITCFGSDGDLARVSVGQLFRDWRPSFKTAVRRTEPGTAPWGGSWWEAEMIFPAKDFELVGPNRAGDVWRMLLGFNHIPIFTQTAVPLNSSYFDNSGWPVMTLVENTPAVQVTMEELPGLKDGMASANISVFNPTSEPVSVNVLAQIEEWKDEKTAEDLLRKETALKIEPGETKVVELNEKLPRDMGTNKGGVYFHITQGDRNLYRYYAYLSSGYPENWVKAPAPSKDAFPLSGKFNPLRNNMLVDVDINYLPKPELSKKALYKITRDGESAIITSGEILNPQFNFFETMIQMPVLKPGDYTVEAEIELADGSRLGPVRTKFQKLDEKKVFADWWNNEIGNINRVIPPFTAVAADGSQVGVWGRVYTLDALGLPSQILSQDKPVLASPARIVVVIDGKEQSIDLGGKVKITERKPWKVVFEGQASGAGLKFATTGSVEQDGLVQVNLTYAPEGAPVKIDSLRLEFPISGAEAEVMNSMGPGGNFATLSAGLLSDKMGTIWSTLEMGAGGSGMTVGNFYPDVWVGNERRGLLWWADSDEGWVPDEKVAAHELVRVAPPNAQDGSNVVLRNNIIGSSFELTAPRTIAFTYNATPFKPFPKGWRATINAEDGTFRGPHKQYTDTVSGQVFDGTQWLSAPVAPADWARVWAEFKVKGDAKVHEEQPFDPLLARRKEYVHTSLALMDYGPLTGDAFTADYFNPEWDHNTLGDIQRDYLLWLAKRAFTEGGLRSIYWDIFFIRAWETIQNGMTYRLPDGRMQPTFNGLSQRLLAMRLSSLQDELGLSPGGITVHSSNCFPFVSFPWVGAGLDGEWAFMTDASTRDWVDNYSPERMRALNTPQNYGVPLTWMSINQITDPIKRGKVWRGFYDWTRFHDCNWYGWDGYRPGAKLLDWGLNDERLEYVPYWRNTAITSEDPKVLVSYWLMPARVFVMAFNHDGTVVKNPVLRLDFAKLGLQNGTPVLAELRGVDVRNDQSPTPEPDPMPVLDVAAKTVTVTDLLPHTARYFGIRVENPDDLTRIQKTFEQVGENVQLTADMLDWGLVSNETRFMPVGSKAGISSTDPGVTVALWQQPDRSLIAVTNTTGNPIPVTLDIDLDKLGLAPKLPWQEFVGTRDFIGGPSRLDFHARKLELGTILPGDVRVLGVRRY